MTRFFFSSIKHNLSHSLQLDLPRVQTLPQIIITSLNLNKDGFISAISSREFQPNSAWRRLRHVGHNLAKHLDPKILNPCLSELTLSWSVSWGVSCTGPHVLVQCVVPLAHSYRAHPPLSPVPFPTTDSGSRANPTERLRLTSRFSLDIPPETQSNNRIEYYVSS
jgi:hypothetical protein